VISADPPLERLAATAAEVESILERLRLGSLGVIASLDLDDPASLERALSIRAELFPLLPPAMESFQAAAARLQDGARPGPGPTHTSRHTERVLQTLEAVRRIEEQLLRRLEQAHVGTARELERLTRADSSATAYGSPGEARGRHLDLTR
jgi:hypothetical protein